MKITSCCVSYYRSFVTLDVSTQHFPSMVSNNEHNTKSFIVHLCREQQPIQQRDKLEHCAILGEQTQALHWSVISSKLQHFHRLKFHHEEKGPFTLG